MNPCHFSVYKINLISILFILNLSFQSYAQKKTYKLYPAADGAITLASSVLTFGGLRSLNALSDIPLDEVLSLDPMDINSFDRKALNQNIYELDEAIRTSDLSMYLTVSMVLSLGIDRKGRDNATEIIIMYLEAVSTSLALQSWVSYGIDRYRPVTYMTDVDVSRRTDYRNKSSFYSGHTSTTATCSFFIAKVWSDLHPELGGKKWLLFTAAIVPPLLVGNFRIKGGKHFYTDVMTGAVIGGAFGILVPEIHKITREDARVSLYPAISLHSTGLGMTIKL